MVTVHASCHATFRGLVPVNYTIIEHKPSMYLVYIMVISVQRAASPNVAIMLSFKQHHNSILQSSNSLEIQNKREPKTFRQNLAK